MEILRKLRKERGLTLNDVSTAIGVTTSYISQIERGLKEPSLEILRNLSKYLGVSTSILLESSDKLPDACECVIIPKAGRHSTHIDHGRDGVTIESLIPNLGSHGLRVYYVTVAPGGYVSGTKVTHPYPEFAYVLSGLFEAHIGKEVYRVEEESSVYIASMVPHDYINIGTETAKIMFVLND